MENYYYYFVGLFTGLTIMSFLCVAYLALQWATRDKDEKTGIYYWDIPAEDMKDDFISIDLSKYEKKDK